MPQILRFIKRVCVQTAIYWEFKGPDGFGGYEFEDACEIKVRWDDTSEVVKDNDGKEIVSSARILTPEDLKDKGYLLLGDFEANPDYDPEGESPKTPPGIQGAYEIKRIQENPLFRSTDKFVRQVWL